MLTYSFPNDSHLTMYEYLYQCIKEDIIHLKLTPHEKLPSKRAFAKNQNVSLITIENAYNQLLIEGYIYSIEKKGYFVSEIQYPNIPTKKAVKLPQEIKKAYLIDLKTNSVSPKHFPFSTWSKLTRQVLSSQDSELLTRPPQQGCLALRETICKHLYAFSGMNVLPQQIIIGAGTEYLYNLVIQLLGRQLIYALENPGHHSISKVYQLNDISYQYIPLDKDGLNIKELKKSQAHVVHISPAHHYPTGITMPIKRRLEILKWANDHQNYIIEDDYDSEFRLRGKPISTLYQIDQNERVIYMNTFSKTLAPSFRISYMVLPPHLVQRFQEKLHFYACSVSSFEQIILAEFMQQGYFEKHINRMRNSYKLIRDDFLSQLHASPIAHQIRITEENAGLHFLLHYTSPFHDNEIVQQAAAIGLHISTLSQFYDIPYDSHTIVVNYSGLAFHQIPVAIELLNRLFT
ncbi:PLP-dependent aminotransferase family protein [Candidatus Stoquefichus massiliensis]|uniref:MocR-like pyridoxine biosynthesis transcription factor PdxR n=1 Tax=Candidatus Stoquefichus massiliensis TaxID=1470350 RepID=UPI00048615F2|nr:PLP-dependent aminotransferase family protein [Candidatus Stoquefichus massiliensis]